MLPAVIAFNARDPDAHDRYLELAVIAGLSSVAELIGEIETILDTARMRFGIDEYGIKRDALPQLAAEAAQQWTAGFNPRPIDAKDFAQLYAEVFA